MIPKTTEELAEAIARLIVDNNNAAQAGDFFSLLEEKLRDAGFTIQAHQRGIAGTYLEISEL